jgi:hypothetical protein
VKKEILWTFLTLSLASGCARFKCTGTERTMPDGTLGRTTVVKAGSLFDSKSELGKLDSGQIYNSQNVSVGSLSQESSASNAVSFGESIGGAAIRVAVLK